MKKTLLIMVMALALLLTQCRKPEVKFPSPVAPEGTTVSMTVTAGPGSKTDITPAGGITWSTGDKLYVGDGSKYVGYLTIVSGVGTPTGTFSGDVTLTGITEDTPHTFGFYYLGSAERTLTVGATSAVVDFSSQNIYAEDGKLKNASAQHVGYGSASGTVKDGVVTGINVTLVSKVALARFSFTKGGTGYSNALTLSGTNIYNEMTVNFNGSFDHGATPDNITLTAGHGERYVMLVPVGTESETLSFAGEGFAGSTTLGNGIEPNKFYGREVAIEVKPKFSVSSGTKVEFAPGNLWADVTDEENPVFHFEENQWETQPASDESWHKNHVSHFLWSDMPGAVSDIDDYSGELFCNDNFTVDGDSHTDWRTLTDDEWKNLLGLKGATSPRDDAKKLCARVTLTDVSVSGFVILPDGSSATASEVTTTALVASSGAVFLPDAGYRIYNSVADVGGGRLLLVEDAP